MTTITKKYILKKFVNQDDWADWVVENSRSHYFHHHGDIHYEKTYQVLLRLFGYYIMRKTTKVETS